MRGLRQHQEQSASCKSRQKFSLSLDIFQSLKHKQMLPIDKVIPLAGKGIEASINKNILSLDGPCTFVNTNKRTFNQLESTQTGAEANDDPDTVFFMDDDSDETINNRNTAPVLPNNRATPSLDGSLRSNFQEYCKTDSNLLSFTKDQLVAIKLLCLLRETKAPLNAYEAHMKWHFEAKGELRSNESVASSASYISRENLYKMLRKRYNLESGYRNITKITLPHSRAQAKIIWHDAKTAMVSLLTDPRIRDEDYLFFGDNPLSPPPEKLNYIGDLNTGKAYLKTYKKLIMFPEKQVLLPVIFYIDGANTGQFADLPVTAVKFSLGIFTRKARDKDHLWRILGYIPAVSKHKSKGRRIIKESGHLDGALSQGNLPDDVGLDDNESVSKAQDLHTMVSVVLRSYIELQNSGFIWDLFYKNQVFKDLEFVLFTPFLKVDGEEADKLCGKYSVRTGNVAQLCRYCMCPTDKADDPKADYKLKTAKKIKRLIDQKDDDALRQMSQQRIENALYAVRFGCHNKQGIHGACPWEMLHALLLGVFRYVRDCFFQQMGEKSKLADKFNAYAQQYGQLFSRQSNRDLPPARFAAGIKRGKLMAKEYPGILLCMAAVFRCTDGRNLLTSKRKKQFGIIGALRDWSQLVETLLQWERWLRSPTMEKKHVRQARDKHRYILYLLKKVAKRSEGMQFKTQKFHGVVHLADDILNFGVPLEVDTGSNESGHKPTKVAAKLTQRNEETFDEQTSIRLEEVYLLDMAKAELEGKLISNYLHEKPLQPITNTDAPKTSVGGSEYYFFYSEDTQQYAACTTKKLTTTHTISLERDLSEFMGGLQAATSGNINRVSLRTCYTRHGHIF